MATSGEIPVQSRVNIKWVQLMALDTWVEGYPCHMITDFVGDKHHHHYHHQHPSSSEIIPSFFPSLFVLRKSFWAFCPPFPLLISSSNLTPSLGTSSTSFSPRWGYQGQARFIPDTSGSSFLDASVGLGSRFHFLAEDRHPVSPPLLRFSCFSPCGEVTQNWVAWYCRVPWE